MPIDWQILIAQVGVVVAAATVWPRFQAQFASLAIRAQNVALGCLMGLAGIVVMLMPVGIGSCLFPDVRGAPIFIAGLFGGPLAVAVAASAALMAQVWLAGSIAAGYLAIGLACVTACGAIKYLSGREIHRRNLLMMSAMGSLFSIIVGSTFEYLVRDDNYKWETGILLVLFTAAAILLAGLAVIHDKRRRALLSANMMYGAIIEALPDGLYANDMRGRILAANSASARLMTVADPSDLIGGTDFKLDRPDVATHRSDDAMRAGEAYTVDRHVVFSDGQDAWLSILKAPFRDGAGQLIGTITHSRDITEQKRLRDELAAMNQLLEYSMENIQDGLVMYDSGGIILLTNRTYRDLFPLTADLRVPGGALADILRAAVARGEEKITADEVEAWVARICGSFNKPHERIFQLTDGRYIEVRTRPLDNGGSLELLADITERKRAEQALTEANNQLALLARTDGLTNLMNRRGFDETLAREAARCSRDGTPLSLLMIDVDWFKIYNDTYGHPLGDACLHRLAQTIAAALQKPRQHCRPLRRRGIRRDPPRLVAV